MAQRKLQGNVNAIISSENDFDDICVSNFFRHSKKFGINIIYVSCFVFENKLECT